MELAVRRTLASESDRVNDEVRRESIWKHLRQRYEQHILFVTAVSSRYVAGAQVSYLDATTGQRKTRQQWWIRRLHILVRSSRESSRWAVYPAVVRDGACHVKSIAGYMQLRVDHTDDGDAIRRHLLSHRTEGKATFEDPSVCVRPDIHIANAAVELVLRRAHCKKLADKKHTVKEMDTPKTLSKRRIRSADDHRVRRVLSKKY